MIRLPFFIFRSFPYRAGFFLLLLLQVLHRGGEHQLDAVELIDLAGAGVIVHGGDIGVGIGLAQGLDDAFAHNVVGQAGEGLDASPYWLPMDRKGLARSAICSMGMGGSKRRLFSRASRAGLRRARMAPTPSFAVAAEVQLLPKN